MRSIIQKKLFFNFLLIFIALLGLGLRLYNISELRLTHDEMSIGYNAFSIWQTGADEWGKRLPLDFQAFGDHKLPLAIYATVPAVALLGNTVLAAKLFSVISGTLIIGCIGLICFELTKSKQVGAFSALIVAVSPAFVSLSRVGLEANLGLFIFSASIYCLLRYYHTNASKFSILFSFLLGLTWYAYVAYRLISVLLILGLTGMHIFPQFKNQRWKDALTPMLTMWVVFLIIIMPLMPVFFSGAGNARLDQTTSTVLKGLQSKVGETHNFCFLHHQPLLSKVCNNLVTIPTELTLVILKEFVSAIGPEFHFIKGSELAEYVTTPGFSSFSVFLLPFLLVGLYSVTNISNYKRTLLALILFVTPIPSAFTGETQIIRASPTLLPILLILGLGLKAMKKIPHKIKLPIITALFFGWGITTSQYFLETFFVYPFNSSENAYALSPHITQAILESNNKFDYIYTHNSVAESHISYLYFSALHPRDFRSLVEYHPTDSHSFTRPKRIGSFEFGADQPANILCRDSSKVLFVGKLFDKPCPEGCTQFMTYYKDFSGVHTEIITVDIGKWRQILQSEGRLQQHCPNLID